MILGEQAQFEGADGHVFQHRARLFDDQAAVQWRVADDILGVLYGQRRKYGGGMASVADQ